MPFSIQTKYISSALKQGDTVAIRPLGFKYYEGDCLKEWLKAGRSFESWRYPFVINYITDANMSGTEPEVLELLEVYSEETEAEFQRKRYLSIPEDYNNPHRIELRETGETRISWAEFSQYIKVRL